MRIKVARIFNTYVQVLKGESITVYGDGKQTRSFCYVDGLIEGFIRLMNTADDFTDPVNLGNSGEFTFCELAGQVIALTGSKSKIVLKLLPSDDPMQRCPDICLAKERLGWEPTVRLRDGPSKTIAYFDSMLELGHVA